MDATVSTSFLILSDTHGDDVDVKVSADVVIHCGDLTEESKLSECQHTLDTLMQIQAPLKLIIAGNHDFTLDDAVFRKKIQTANLNIGDPLVIKEYGAIGTAKALFTSPAAKQAGVVFLDEGIHNFNLSNGARLTLFTSPYTPGVSEWGFQYSLEESHSWSAIARSRPDIIITHGPPRGILDYTSSKNRAGCPQLFRAVATARPLMHCFGHIHEGWGAKKVAWRESSEDGECEISHFTSVDNDKSEVIETLARIETRKWDSEETRREKVERLNRYRTNGCCEWDGTMRQGGETLFVNAAMQGDDDKSQHLPWLVRLDLPRSENTAV